MTTAATDGVKITAAQEFCDRFNADYEARHAAFEEQFWGTKMALSSTEKTVYSAENLTATKTAMERLLSDPAVHQEASQHLLSVQTLPDTDELRKVLQIIVRTAQCYQMPPQAQELREATSKLESELEMARNQMKLGYTVDGVFQEASSVGLRNLLRTNPSEKVRKAAYEGLRSIGPFVLDHGFVEIIKLRNQMAKKLGYLDYYDYKVTNAEGFGKDRLFAMLDGLEQGTRPILVQARQELERQFGKEALEPWNTNYQMAGSIIAKMHPYFPFAQAVERYVRSYAALGITYKDATMRLDLLDRPAKYSNGFCHWPQPAWIKPDGTWQPSTANFTSLADPAAVGSGLTALQTLMHEAGHAAHFANITQTSPLFAQERAPTSVAYAENQSMFLDSLVQDAAWRAKYARNAAGEPLPWELVEEEIRATHPFAVLQLRAMLSVSYFEKAIYELPENQVTAIKIQELADEIEKDIQGGLGARPLLSVPHLVSDEASCYYQGYTLVGFVESCACGVSVVLCSCRYCISLLFVMENNTGGDVSPPDSTVFQTARRLHCGQPVRREHLGDRILAMRQFASLFGDCAGLDRQGAVGRRLGEKFERTRRRQGCARTQRVRRNDAEGGCR